MLDVVWSVKGARGRLLTIVDGNLMPLLQEDFYECRNRTP